MIYAFFYNINIHGWYCGLFWYDVDDEFAVDDDDDDDDEQFIVLDCEDDSSKGDGWGWVYFRMIYYYSITVKSLFSLSLIHARNSCDFFQQTFVSSLFTKLWLFTYIFSKKK